MAPPEDRVRLVVLYGGRSAEHDVSCVSAANVVSAVDRSRYDLQLIGVTTTGAWVDATAAALAAAGAKALPSPDRVTGGASGGSADDSAVEPDDAAPGGLAGGLSRLLPSSPAASRPDAEDRVETVVLPLIHGPMGEDGTVQGLLELAGVPYCGPTVAGSAVAMDKGLAKATLAAAGIPQARYLYRRETHFGPELAAEIEAQLGWPAFVKPANMGSSIGITKVKDPGGLEAALEVAARYDSAVVIEQAVEGARELEIGVLGWPELRASVPGEIRASRDFYDYEDKYVTGTAQLEVPARVPAPVADEMARMAVDACEAMHVDSMARVDFFYGNDGRLLVNEVNTIPGFTPISMFPLMWAASGIPYSELIDVLVEQARHRAGRRRSFQTGH